MRRQVLQWSLALLAGLAGAAQAAVTVSFTQPDRYADIGRTRVERPDVLKEIEGYLKHLGATHAPARNVRIEVLDIDLAGDERFRAGRDIRVLRGGADWPRIHLRYTLEEGGRAVESREETVADMNYLMRSIPRGEPLAYEKRMLEEWFRARFGAPATARR